MNEIERNMSNINCNNMNKMKKFLPLAMVALGLFSCTDHDAVPDEVQQSKGNVFATLSLSLPQAGSRSTTVDPGDNPAQSNVGFEYGKDYENEVKSVLVVLATKAEDNSYKYITSNLCDPTKIDNTENGAAGKPNPTFRVQFESQALIENAEKVVYVFAYCNASKTCVDAIMSKNSGDDFTDLEGVISDKDNADIWREKGFFMSNALIHATPEPLPSVVQMNTVYNRESNPFNLGQVKVERAAVRFDFVDTVIDDELGVNKYPIYEYVEEKTEKDENGNESIVIAPGELQGYVTIDGMALFNERKDYYYPLAELNE